MKLRSPFSVTVADYIRNGYTISEALMIVIGGIKDGSGPRTTQVLDDLQDMGVIYPLSTDNRPQIIPKRQKTI